MLEVEGVNVVTGKEVDAAFAHEEKADVVIVPGLQASRACQLWGDGASRGLHRRGRFSAEIGNNVVAVLGFNAQTVDAAHYLTAQGKKVTIVSDEPEEAFGTGQSMMLDKFVEPVFLAAGGSVRSESKLKSVGDGEVVLTRASVSTSPFRATVWSTLRTWWPALRWPMNFPAISTLWPWVTARPR